MLDSGSLSVLKCNKDILKIAFFWKNGQPLSHYCSAVLGLIIIHRAFGTSHKVGSFGKRIGQYTVFSFIGSMGQVINWKNDSLAMTRVNSREEELTRTIYFKIILKKFRYFVKEYSSSAAPQFGPNEEPICILHELLSKHNPLQGQKESVQSTWESHGPPCIQSKGS